jgi:hypothetical protein
MVVAVRDLAAVRDRPCGRALEEFLRQMSDWGRSAAAWEDFGQALGMTPDGTVDALIGSGVVLAGSGMDPRHKGPAQFAVLSTVAPETEALLRNKLRPAPRGIVENLPVLSLEKGAYQLAISVPRRAAPGDGSARLLVAPEDSSDLFDELIPVLKGKAALNPLSSDGAWERVRDLGPGDLLFLLRSKDAGPSAGKPEDLFALTASQTADGWTARFSASESMLIGTVGAGDDKATWPTAAVEALEEGSVLLVAGSPREPKERAPLGADRPLLLELLEMMDLPPEIKASLNGNSIIAVHAEGAAGSPSEALSVVAALPADDMARFSGMAERWAMSRGVEGDNGEKAPVRLRQGVRSVPIQRAAPAIIPEPLRTKGVMAWCYAHERWTPPEDSDGPGPMRGWWVISMRFGAGDPGLAGVVARRAAELLDAEEGKDTGTLFRLVVRPRELAGLIRSPEALNGSALTGMPLPGATRTRDPLAAMRWLEQVDSWVSRGSKGQVEGTVSLRLNLDLLDKAK